MNDDDWYVGKVRMNSESKLAGSLEERGVEAFCPFIRQKGPRRRTDGTREAIERPALQGYLPIRAEHVDAPATREYLEQEPDFRDFLRDINNDIARMLDSALDPLRSMEKAEPVQFIAGPVFYLSEVVKIGYNNPHVPKAFWGMTGQIVNVKRGRYCLGGHDFTMEAWFSGMQLLANS